MRTNQSGLAERAMDLLPLGAVSPTGWFRRQLEIQAQGYTGPLDDRWIDLRDNAWQGGSKDGWERGPYYADGLVPLSILLDYDELKQSATQWVDAFVKAQAENGHITPGTVEASYDRSDLWSRFIVLKVLRQYVEATGDDDAHRAISKFPRDLHETDTWSLTGWAEYRWADLLVTIEWLYRRTNHEWLVDLAGRVVDEGYDWSDHFAKFRYRRPLPVEAAHDDRKLETHGVNLAMEVKAPAFTGRMGAAHDGGAQVDEAFRVLDRYHGQVTGMFTADEHLAGKSPTRGTELCAVVELLYSLEELLSIAGDPTYADRLEFIAYNALPATFSPVMTAHQYDQQVNQPLCSIADRGWTNGPDATLFGQTPQYGCCHANGHQGWPKLARSLWLQTDDGLATGVYAPCTLETTVEDVDVRIRERTAYLFSDTVTIDVDPDRPITFPLELRIPSWAENAVVTAPDGTRHSPPGGEYCHVETEWTPGMTIELSFSPSIDLERRYNGAGSLRRGPLVFSLRIDEDWQAVEGELPDADWALYPNSPWNYAIDIDPERPDNGVTMSRTELGDRPFSPDGAPIEIELDGCRDPRWSLENGSPADVPESPVELTGDTERITLIPYGCTNLRVTEFPLLS